MNSFAVVLFKLSNVLATEVEWKDQTHRFRFIFFGCKGDWPFLRAAYSLACGYNCSKICHRCDIREPGN